VIIEVLPTDIRHEQKFLVHENSLTTLRRNQDISRDILVETNCNKYW
jgi:hypothetical protein